VYLRLGRIGAAIGHEPHPVPNHASNGRNLRLSSSPRRMSESRSVLLPASGSVGSSFFTRERSAEEPRRAHRSASRSRSTRRPPGEGRVLGLVGCPHFDGGPQPPAKSGRGMRSSRWGQENAGWPGSERIMTRACSSRSSVSPAQGRERTSATAVRPVENDQTAPAPAAHAALAGPYGCRGP
jgi:hypothetical protein